MSMWEPRSSHLYVGRGVACRLWLLCFLCVRGAGAHTGPLRPPRLEAGGRVCVCVRACIQCAPLHPCVRAFVDLCVQSWFCVRPTSSCVCRAVQYVCVGACRCLWMCSRVCSGGVSSVCICVCSWVFLCA